MLPLLLAAALGSSDTLRITDAWVRATPTGAPTAAAYLPVENAGRSADRLTGIASADAARVEIHSMDVSGGVMRMRPVPSAIVPAGGQLALKPGGGLHLMLIAPKRTFQAGDVVSATLVFERAGKRSVNLPVRAQ